MLQVATKSKQVQTNLTMPVQSLQHYTLFAQHKSGSMMAWEAAMSMQRAVGKESKLRFHFNHALGSALSPPEMVGPRGTPRCLLHFSRNPFEMVVSGYMYHMAKSETW